MPRKDKPVMNVFSSKLTKRYILLTLVVCIFVLSAVYWFTVRIMNTSYQEQILNRDEVIARTLGRRIDFLMKKVVNDMRVVSTFMEKDRVTYKSEIEKMLIYEPLYLFIQTFDRHGNLMTRIPEVEFRNPLKIEEISSRLSWSQTYYISNLITLPNGKKTIAIAFPVLKDGDTYQGGVIAYINLNVLSDYLKEIKIGEQGINAVVDREGTVFAHSYVSEIGYRLKQHPLGLFLSKERYGVWEGDLFGQRMIVEYRPMVMGQFGIIVGEPVQQARAPLYEFMAVLLRGFIFILLVALGLGLYGTSRVVRPILSLIEQVTEYRANKRKHFDVLSTKDELEQLSMTLDQMARELKRKERTLFNILESIPYAVFTTNQMGKITSFNQGAEQLTGFQREEVIGRDLFDLPIKESKEEFMTWRTLNEGKEFDEVESYILNKDGTRHVVRIYSSLFKEEHDKEQGAIVVIRDVSEIKKLEEYAKQHERLSALGQLTAGIAHEIKNPLSIIQAAAEAADLDLMDQKGKENEFLREMLRDILETTDRMNLLLSDFLQLSKGEDNKDKQYLNLVQILEELLQLLSRKIKDQDIQLQRDMPVSRAEIYGNKNRLTQVFLNIILNSLQAMDGGGQIDVRLKEAYEYWEVEIRDTGKGIPASMISWIFNPFFSTKREGTGLGLSIAHEILTQHGGKIWAESEEGMGTSLFVQIPKVK